MRRVLLGLRTGRWLRGHGPATSGRSRCSGSRNGNQIGIVALPARAGRRAESLSRPLRRPRRVRVERHQPDDISQRIDLLLAPAVGARRRAPGATEEGAHVLSVGVARRGAPGHPEILGHTVARCSGILVTGWRSAQRWASEIKEPVWVQARPADAVSIDTWRSVDRPASPKSDEPWALLLDPEQLGDGRHDLARASSHMGRAGPS